MAAGSVVITAASYSWSAVLDRLLLSLGLS